MKGNEKSQTPATRKKMNSRKRKQQSKSEFIQKMTTYFNEKYSTQLFLRVSLWRIKMSINCSSSNKNSIIILCSFFSFFSLVYAFTKMTHNNPLWLSLLLLFYFWLWDFFSVLSLPSAHLFNIDSLSHWRYTSHHRATLMSLICNDVHEYITSIALTVPLVRSVFIVVCEIVKERNTNIHSLWIRENTLTMAHE